MNLRLPADAERALRERSAESGRSQQELVRLALDHYLGRSAGAAGATGAAARLVGAGLVLPPRTPYRRPVRVALAAGQCSEELLDREERF